MNYYPINYSRKNNSSLDSVKDIVNKLLTSTKTSDSSVINNSFKSGMMNNFALKLEDPYKSDLSKFKEELDLFISKYGFEETYIESIEDGMISEKMFYIKSPKDKSFDELDIYLEEIIKHMESFSKSNHLHSFFMNSYIMFD